MRSRLLNSLPVPFLCLTLFGLVTLTLLFRSLGSSAGEFGRMGEEGVVGGGRGDVGNGNGNVGDGVGGGGRHKMGWHHTAVGGYFLQGEEGTDGWKFDYTKMNFGLIDRVYDTDAEYDPAHEKTQWQRFEHKVSSLNRDCGPNVQYKVLFMGRHGEGYHNVAEAFYGTSDWDCYWSKQDGNGTITWFDSYLTTKGEAQALVAHGFWAMEIVQQKIPTPQSYYTSPLSRCLETAKLTFTGLDLPAQHPFVPEVKELFRESLGVHTCDRRRGKTYIHENYPSYTFEAGFAEDDLLWDAIKRETENGEDVRLKNALDDVFSHDLNTYVSITSHSGAIAAILRVIGHPEFRLNTGAVIPVLVKAEKVATVSPTSSKGLYATVSTCIIPPPSQTL